MSQNYKPQYFTRFLKPFNGDDEQLTGWMMLRREKWTQSYQHVCLYGYSDAPIHSIEDEGLVFEPFDYAYGLLGKCIGQVVGMYVDVNPTSKDERPAFEMMLKDVLEHGVEVIACRTLTDLSAGNPTVLERILDLERQQKVSIMLMKPLEGDNELWEKMLTALLSINRKTKLEKEKNGDEE